MFPVERFYQGKKGFWHNLALVLTADHWFDPAPGQLSLPSLRGRKFVPDLTARLSLTTKPGKCRGEDWNTRVHLAQNSRENRLNQKSLISTRRSRIPIQQTKPRANHSENFADYINEEKESNTENAGTRATQYGFTSVLQYKTFERLVVQRTSAN